MTDFLYIPNEIEELVGNVATALGTPVYFDKGHYQVVENNLTAKDKGISQKNSKYPLIWLVMDYEETMDGLFSYINPSLIIAKDTDLNYTMDERRDKSFLPVLYPIYDELLRQISISSKFGMPAMGKISHTKIDRPYWGIQSGLGNGEKNMFHDYIDAIEIKRLKLSLRRKIC